VLFYLRNETIVTRCQTWAVGWMFHLYKTAFVDYFKDLARFVNSAIVMKQHNLLIAIGDPFLPHGNFQCSDCLLSPYRLLLLL
jgi:hypothetical protein